MIRTKFYGAAVGTLALIGGAIAFSTPGQTASLQPAQVSGQSFQLAQSSVNTAELEVAVYRQINQFRANQGLPPLARFGHSGFGPRIQAIGISYRGAAENVAYNQGYRDAATQAVQGWLRSSRHLANIRGNYNLTGVGVAVNSRGAIYFTQLFIRKT